MNTSSIVIPNRLIFGSYPNINTLVELKTYGITMLVDLTGTRQVKKTDKYDSINFDYIYFPIKDRESPTDITKFQNFISDLLIHYKKGANIYIHCIGGHGRSGMIAAVLTKLILGITVEQALIKIYEAHQKRIEMKDKMRKLGSPQTAIQKKFVKAYFDSKIDFYDSKFIYFEFSNFYLVKISIDGIEYKSTEHYYQSQKFVYEGASEQSILFSKIIAEQNTPGKTYYLAKQQHKTQYKWMQLLNDIINKYPEAKLDPEWDGRKLEVMEKAIRVKFENITLRNLLLSTKGKEIRENSPRDWYWGIGKDGKGENNLGKLLMKLRDE